MLNVYTGPFLLHVCVCVCVFLFGRLNGNKAQMVK